MMLDHVLEWGGTDSPVQSVPGSHPFPQVAGTRRESASKVREPRQAAITESVPPGADLKWFSAHPGAGTVQAPGPSFPFRRPVLRSPSRSFTTERPSPWDGRKRLTDTHPPGIRADKTIRTPPMPLPFPAVVGQEKIEGTRPTGVVYRPSATKRSTPVLREFAAPPAVACPFALWAVRDGIDQVSVII